MIENIIMSANGKITLMNTPLDSMETKTLKLITGVASGMLVIDVDNPSDDSVARLLKLISKKDCFVVSSQYTLDDVFNQRCRFKIIYNYNSDKELPNPRLKKDEFGNSIPLPIEIFYNKSKNASIIGDRHDGYKYVMYNSITDIHFDLQDIVDYKIKFKLVRKNQGNEKIERVSKEDELFKSLTPEESEEVNSQEFTQLITRIMGTCPTVIKKNDTLLTFPCLFPELHSKKNNAYAFKVGGHYVVKCQGVVCDGEYINLNHLIKQEFVDSVDFNFDGFGLDLEKGSKVKVFIAPTSFGKTEKIAQEILNAISEDRKLLVVCQSKEAIERLKNRVNYYSGGAMPTFEQNSRIYTWISENNDGKLEESFIKANVIITHHYYLANAGDIISHYPALTQVLSLLNLEIIVDEAHTWLELATQLSLEVGGLYKHIVNDRYIQNRKRLTKDQVANKKDSLFEFSSCLEASISEYGTVELHKQYKLYKTLDYIDLLTEIKRKFTPSVDSLIDDTTKYTLYKNPNPISIQANNLDEADQESVLRLILEPSEYILVSELMGDDIPRATIGRVIVNFYYYSLLKMIFDRAKSVILTSATMTDYHFNCLDRTTKYDTIRIESQISKIKKVVLLSKQRDSRKYLRNQILDNLNDTNAQALLFMPTIANAKSIVAKYDNMICNDNGWYTILNRVSQSDYIDNFKRNVVVCGLESSVAKGYNFMEEVGEDAEGFDIVYFDSEPVSPDVLKKYIGTDDKIIDYYDTYAMTSFTQAIGRALRKEKDQLTICLNNISPFLVDAIKQYLENTLTCEIICDELNLTNLKISTKKDIEDTDVDLSSNELYKKLYLKGETENEM